MLNLFVNETSLDLSADISITLKFSSPIFNTIGDYTYPFKLPATPLNVSILGFKHRIEKISDPYQVFDACLQWNGVLLLKGTLRIIKAQSDFYEATLFMDKGDFTYRRKNMTLQDVDFGEMTWTGETLKIDYFNDCRGHVFPERNFGFPQIHNPSYFEEPPLDQSNNYFNYYLTGTMYYFGSDDPRTILVPMLYLRFVLDRLFQKLEFNLDDSFFTPDPDFNSLALFNSVDANCTLTGPFNYDKLKVFLSYHVPVISVNEFLTGLENFFNIRFFVNNITKTVKLVSVDKIVKSTDAIEFSRNVSDIYTELGDPVTGFHLKMNMESDDEFWTLLKSQQDYSLDKIKPPVDSASNLSPWPGSQNLDFRWVRDENRYYMMYNRLWIVSPFPIGNLFSEFIYRESAKTIETKASTLMNQTLAPYDCVIGTAQSSWDTISPKLFFMNLHPWSGIGTRDERVYASNSLNTKSLFFSGENGLFAKYFKAFCDFQMSSKQVKFVKQMSLLDINELDFSRKYMINGDSYLLSDVQVTISNAGLKPATIRGFTSV
ncbi:MAG: hypothetical protein Q8M08_17455 [Bacteroidales bacterium]|nr:hypothetical protein [Bacteroidales bacterium]